MLSVIFIRKGMDILKRLRTSKTNVKDQEFPLLLKKEFYLYISWITKKLDRILQNNTVTIFSNVKQIKLMMLLTLLKKFK